MTALLGADLGLQLQGSHLRTLSGMTAESTRDETPHHLISIGQRIPARRKIQSVSFSRFAPPIPADVLTVVQNTLFERLPTISDLHITDRSGPAIQAKLHPCGLSVKTQTPGSPTSYLLVKGDVKSSKGREGNGSRCLAWAWLWLCTMGPVAIQVFNNDELCIQNLETLKPESLHRKG